MTNLAYQKADITLRLSSQSYGFYHSHIKLSAKELMLLDCGVEDS